MENNPFISIITITYNNKANLLKTILCVQKQTFKNIEFIIIDGGSTDGTIDLTNNYSGIITHFISEPDSGIYDAMNKGLKLATGTYVWFVNAGDEIFSESTIENLYNICSGADALYGDAEYVDESGNYLGARTLKKPPETFTYKDMKFGMVVIHQSFIVKKDIAGEYNINYKHCADIDWMIRSMKKAGKVLNTKMTLSKFLIGGYSKKNIIRSNIERFQILKLHYGLWTTILSHFILLYKFIIYYFTHKKKYY